MQQVGGRFISSSAGSNVKLSVVLQLKQAGSNVEPIISRHILETDAATLGHCTKTLQQALQHGKDRHSRRLAKNI